MTLKKKWHLKDLAKFRGMPLYNMPIMPSLCSKLAYYAGIMLIALACTYYASNYVGIFSAGLKFIYLNAHVMITAYIMALATLQLAIPYTYHEPR